MLYKKYSRVFGAIVVALMVSFCFSASLHAASGKITIDAAGRADFQQHYHTAKKALARRDFAQFDTEMAYLGSNYNFHPAYKARLVDLQLTADEVKTALTNKKLYTEAAQVRKRLKTGDIRAAEEYLNNLKEQYPDEPLWEDLDQEIQVKKYVSLQRLKHKLDMISDLVEGNHKEVAIQKTQQLQTAEGYIPSFYQDEIHSLLDRLEVKDAATAQALPSEPEQPTVTVASKSSPVPAAVIESTQQVVEEAAPVQPVLTEAEPVQREVIQKAFQETKTVIPQAVSVQPVPEQTLPAVVEPPVVLTPKQTLMPPLTPAPAVAPVIVSSVPDAKAPVASESKDASSDTMSKKMMKEIAAAQKQEQQRQEKFARAQKKELFSAVQEMIGQEKIPQAERLIEQFASAYPGDYWVGVLQRQLDKKKKIIARREDVARQAAARSIVAVEKKEEEEPIVVASQPAPVIGKKTSEIVSPLVSVPVKVSRTADRPVTAHVPADRAQKKAIARALDNKIEELKDAIIKKLDALVDNGKAEQAGKILMQLVESYPDDPKVKKAQRVLEEKIEHMQERQRRYAAWALQERIRTQYDQRIQKIKVLLSKKQKDEALSLLSALPEELRANDPRIKKIERQIQRLKEKARMASAPSVKPVKSVQKKRKITSVSTDASAISYGQFQEKQSYVEKLYAEGIRLYEQGLYDDAVRVFRIVVKMEKGITAAFTPAAKEYIKKAEDHKKDLASDR